MWPIHLRQIGKGRANEMSHGSGAEVGGERARPSSGQVVVTWIVGGTAPHFAERGTNPGETLGESLWNVWVILFSGLRTPQRVW